LIMTTASESEREGESEATTGHTNDQTLKEILRARSPTNEHEWVA